MVTKVDATNMRPTICLVVVCFVRDRSLRSRTWGSDCLAHGSSRTLSPRESALPSCRGTSTHPHTHCDHPARLTRQTDRQTDSRHQLRLTRHSIRLHTADHTHTHTHTHTVNTGVGFKQLDNSTSSTDRQVTVSPCHSSPGKFMNKHTAPLTDCVRMILISFMVTHTHTYCA